MIQIRPSRKARLLVVFAAALAMTAGTVEARPGKGGFSFGSRGSNTFQAPPSTSTAPRTAAPIERSTTQAPRPGVNQGVQRPGMATASRGLFGRGGFMGGLFGAGLIGLLLGYGLFGGLGGFASVLGLLLQVLLFAGLAMLAFRFFQRRQEPAYAGATPPSALRREAAPVHDLGARGGPGGGRPAGPMDEVGIGQADYEAFERLLSDIQLAYGREDIGALRANATPEMVSYLAEELAADASRGVSNRVSDVRLLQGDLAEAWREGNVEYATVAMRFALRDWTVDREDGRILEGDPDRLTETTEVWTFMRTRGGRWLLSAIQQA